MNSTQIENERSLKHFFIMVIISSFYYDFLMFLSKKVKSYSFLIFLFKYINNKLIKEDMIML